jgi:hypothetical protein
MHGIRVKDLAPQGHLSCDLRDFLDLLGDTADSSQWRVTGDVWAIGTQAEELEACGDAPTPIPGFRLRQLASAVSQVIDGEFTGFRADDHHPWVVIRAVDSSYYEFFCQEPAILKRARERFRDTAECEADPEPKQEE